MEFLHKFDLAELFLVKLAGFLSVLFLLAYALIKEYRHLFMKGRKPLLTLPAKTYSKICRYTHRHEMVHASFCDSYCPVVSCTHSHA